MTSSNPAQSISPFWVLLTPAAAFQGLLPKSRLALLILLLSSSMVPAFAFNAHSKSEDAITLQIKRAGKWEKLNTAQQQKVLKSMKVIGPVGASFKRLFFIGLVSLLCWWMLRGFSDTATFLQILLAVTTACVPLLFRDMLAAAVFMLRDPTTLDLKHPVQASLAAFMPDSLPAIIKIILLRLDLFTLWVSALIGMGVNISCNTKSKLPWLVVVAFWGFLTLFEIL